jgi:hypothetical protein
MSGKVPLIYQRENKVSIALNPYFCILTISDLKYGRNDS